MHQALEKVLDLVYPSKCCLCGTLGAHPVCGICLSHFEEHENVLFRTDQPLDYAGALFDYTGLAARVVQRFKYERVTSLASWMADCISAGAADRNLLYVDIIVPVPIHWRRLAMRGFNQAELLCEKLPAELVRRDVLKRSRETRPQVGLSHEERTLNLSGAFEVMADVTDLSVLLVDDVLTSGGTASECAKALKDAGAREVGMLAFAAEHRWNSL